MKSEDKTEWGASDSTSQRGAEAHGAMTIGAVSRATGIPVETLRTWERRYGYPQPLRTHGGHRVYQGSCVERLRNMAKAIEMGHRASCVVGAPEAEVDSLLSHSVRVGASPNAANQLPALSLDGLPRRESSSALPANGAAIEAASSAFHIQFPALAGSPICDWLKAVHALDASALDRGLQLEWSRLGTIRFLSERLGPMLAAVGDAWRSGSMTVCHEHFASERSRDFLTSIWRPLSDRASGPTIVCATLPPELHSLGLHMAASVAALAGFKVIFLGIGAPLADVAAAAKQSQTQFVLVSVSSAMDSQTSRPFVAELRELLGAEVTVVVGGSGAPRDVPDTVAPADLQGLYEFLQSTCHPTAI